MPVISKNKIWFEETEFLRIIHCGADGVFSCNLPEPVMETLGLDKVAGTTKQACEQEFNKALKQYESCRTSTRKVLLYRVRTSARIVRDDCCIHNSDQMSFVSGVAINISAAVFEEVCINQANGNSRFKYNRLPSNLPDSIADDNHRELRPHDGRKAENQIEWTEEREQFFTKLGLSLENIILELSKLKSPKELESIISSGALTFAAPKQLK